MARILFTCFGSYGDLYPYVSLGKALQRRGHEVTIATTNIFQEKIEKEGLAFYYVRSNLDQYSTPQALQDFLVRIFDPLKGGEIITREMMARVEDSYNDTLIAAKNADLLIANPLAYASPIVCREKNLPWLSTVLAPMFFLSAYDPPIMAPAPWLKSLNNISPAVYRGVFKLIKKSTNAWSKPLFDLCTFKGIEPPIGNPLFEGQYSPYGTLAMFPDFFAEKQPDWPVNVHVTGFTLFSGEEADTGTLNELQKFINAGEPPMVFALGSSAVNIADDFFKVSADISRKLNRRAVLVTGSFNSAVQGIEPGKDLFIVNYVAYDKLFPQASVIVHQGGIGTLAQSICAQKPMLVVPFGFDQFDNAERVEKLGLGKSLRRKNYTVSKAAPIIASLLTHANYQQRATELGQLVNASDGAENACNVIEEILVSHA